MTPSGIEVASQPPRKRRRPARSCQECRRRKVKCNLEQPCGQCVISKCVCVYNIGPTPVQAVAIDAVPQQSTSVDFRQPGPLSSKRLAQQSSPNNHSSQLSPINNSSRNTECELTSPRHRSRAIEEDLALSHVYNVNSKSMTQGPKPDSLECEQSPDISQRILWSQNRVLALNKSRLYGPSHWTHGGDEFKKLSVLNEDTSQSTEVEAAKQQRLQLERLLHRCKLLAQRLKENDPGTLISQPVSSLLPSCKVWADQMAELYITHFEPLFRMHHVPSFWAEYEHFWKNPEQASTALSFKMKLIAAIGSSLYRGTSDADNVRLGSCRWVREAQVWVSGPIYKDRISLSGLQVQCLLIIARQVLSVGGDLVWISVGTLVRTAMQMGLHRDPKHFATMPVLQAEVRRRLWATILEINLQASLDSGAPLAISFDDFDTNSPGNVNDADINESTNALAYYADNTVTDMSLQLLLLKYLRPRAEIIRRINGAYSGFSQDEVQSITSILNKACRECSANLQIGNGDAVEVFKHNMVDLLLRRFLLTLHRPLATASRVSDPTFHFSRKVCLDSATALLSPPQNAEFSRLVLLGSGIFKNRIIHASLAICSDLIIELEELRPMGWPSTYRKMLVEVLREAVKQAAERIRLGETNLRLHMKLNIVLFHAECTEFGSARQLRMVQVAQESLEKSYAIMQSRLGLAVGEQYEEGAPGRQKLGWQDLSVALNEDWDEPYDMADIGLDELLWSDHGVT